MPRYSPDDLQLLLKDKLLSFPATPFRDDLEVDEPHLSAHLDWQSSFDIGGLFVAGGTGEGFSLTNAESQRVVEIAVGTVRDGVPVLGSVTGGTFQAVQQAKAACKAGADGVLILPPYLTETTQEGLYAHVAAVLEATDLAVIIYNRANALYDAATVARLAERYPHFIGFKDGIADLEQLARITTTVGDRLFYLGGLPTAETYAPSLLAAGMSTYSSAMFNFVPEFALEFYRDVRRHNADGIKAKLRDFVFPYLDLRNRGNGYGVSIVKAGLRSIGRGCGPVRPPLSDLHPDEQSALDQLVAQVTPAMA